jgi:acetyl-CoA C-acetyltransferase
VLSAVRTAIGNYGGGLATVPPCDLAATVVREAVSRAGVAPADVGHAVFGQVFHTEARDMYLAGHHVHRRQPGHRRGVRTDLTGQ